MLCLCERNRLFNTARGVRAGEGGVGWDGGGDDDMVTDLTKWESFDIFTRREISVLVTDE